MLALYEKAPGNLLRARSRFLADAVVDFDANVDVRFHLHNLLMLVSLVKTRLFQFFNLLSFIISYLNSVPTKSIVG